MAVYPKLSSLDLKEKRVFLRADLNVPLEEKEGRYVVTNTNRLEGVIPTIRYILEQGGKCILASHLGRPKGKRVRKYSLEPVGAKLSELLGMEVTLTEDCVGDVAKGLSHRMHAGDLLLLENLRFHPGEEANEAKFAQDLQELCDVYVTDAFGAVHRAHASTAALPNLMEHKAVGLLVEKELSFLEPLRDEPKRPFGLIMGGAKISDKIGILEQFLPKVDRVFIGGAMAYAFLKAKGVNVGSSLCDADQVKLAAKLIRAAEVRQIEMCLPFDHVVAKEFGDVGTMKTTDDEAIEEGFMGLDIGPRTVAQFEKRLEGLETVFWNGPMGVFEIEAFSRGTSDLAQAVAHCSAQKLAGGGDVAAAIANSGCEGKFDFISTGGGATLEFLEGKDLPGLKSVAYDKRYLDQLEAEASEPEMAESE